MLLVFVLLPTGSQQLRYIIGRKLGKPKMLSWLYCVVVLRKIYVFGLFWVYSLASTQCSGQTSVSSPKNQGLIYEVSAKEIIMQTMWGHRFSIQTGRSQCRHSDTQPHPVICMNCWIVNPCIFCIDSRVHETIEFYVYSFFQKLCCSRTDFVSSFFILGGILRHFCNFLL